MSFVRRSNISTMKPKKAPGATNIHSSTQQRYTSKKKPSLKPAETRLVKTDSNSTLNEHSSFLQLLDDKAKIIQKWWRLVRAKLSKCVENSDIHLDKQETSRTGADVTDEVIKRRQELEMRARMVNLIMTLGSHE